MADIATRDFLFEIGTEEMPSAPLNNAIGQLGTLVEKGLDEAGLSHGEVRTLSTPRRLAVIVSDVAEATAEVNDVKRGPAAQIAFDESGAPTKAAIGFAKKNGVDPAELVRREDADGKEYVFAETHVDSRPALPILSALCEGTIGGLEWPNYRSQRWGSEHVTFVRPVRWICSLFGAEVVPVTYGDVTSGNTTRGHRVLGKGDHVVPSPAEYERVLEDAYVLGEKRRVEVIREGIFIASADLAGLDKTNWFWGGSSIIGPSKKTWAYHYYAGGPFVAEGSDEEAMYTATIDLSLATRFLYKYNPSVGGTDWRPDLYAKWFSELAGDPEFGKKEA